MTPMRRRCIALVLLWLLPLAAGAASVLKTIPLKNRMADEVAAIIRPLAPDVAVVASGGEILLRGEEAQVNDLAQAVARLDVAQKRLRISVRQGGDGVVEREGAELRGSAAQPQPRVFATRDREQPELNQQVQAVEGVWARVVLGRAIPVVEQSITAGPQGSVVRQGTEYKEVNSGFEILPRVMGQNVVVEVRAFHGGTARENGGVLERSQVQSTVQGPLGAWLDVGGSLTSATRDERGTVYATRSREERQSRVQIKIELIE